MTAGLALSLVLLPSCASDDEPGNYLSMGDSYAQGLQPPVDGESTDLTNGFAYLVADKADSDGWDLDLENFACGGATVKSMVDDPGCWDTGRSEEGPGYDVPQLEAAIAFLEDHPEGVDLITIVIGINDVLPCVKSHDDQLACVTETVAEIEGPLVDALADLRSAAGPDTVIMGLSYPNVALGAYITEDDPALASVWGKAFGEVINPMLKESYESVEGIFVDVTDETGAYVPFGQTTTLEPYGEIPVAVAELCQLTWSCEGPDVHPNDVGHEVMADLIVDALPPPPASDD